MIHVVDLRAIFGSRYRIERDPAYNAQYGANARVRDPWYDVIPGQTGEIFPWGDSRLAVSSYANGAVATRLRHLACGRVEQDGQDGVTISFDVADFDQVARIVRPRRRQPATDRRLAALAEGRRKLGHLNKPAVVTRHCAPESSIDA